MIQKTENETQKETASKPSGKVARIAKWSPQPFTGEAPHYTAHAHTPIGKAWDRCPYTQQALRERIELEIKACDDKVWFDHQLDLWRILKAAVKVELGAHPVVSGGSMHLYQRNLGVWVEAHKSSRWLLYRLLDGLEVDGGAIKMNTRNLTALDTFAMHDRQVETEAENGDHFATESPGAILLTRAERGVRPIDAEKALMLHQPQRDGTVKVVHPQASDRKRTLHWSQREPLDSVVFEEESMPAVPEWTDYLEGLLGQTEERDLLIENLEMFLGACLCGIATDYDKVFVLEGSGNNGKSGLIDVIRKLLFDPSQVACSGPQNWADKFGSRDLEGKLINLVSELDDRSMMSSTMLKAVVTGDLIRAEIKNGASYSFSFRGGNLWSTNGLPEMRDQSYGFKRRFEILPLTQDFSKNGKSRQMSEIFAELAPRKYAIVQRLIWRAAQLKKQKRYNKTAHTTKRLEEWSSESSPISAFVAQCLEVKSHFTTKQTDIYEEFEAFAVKNSLSAKEVPSRIRFYRELAAAGVPKVPKKGATDHFDCIVKKRMDW